MSPAVTLVSETGSEPGEGAKSLKVVKTSDWLADVWILSSVRESCSLSTCEDMESDIVESRRGRAATGDGGTEGPREGCPSPFGLAMVASFCQSDARVFATQQDRRDQESCFGDRIRSQSKDEFRRGTSCRAATGIPIGLVDSQQQQTNWYWQGRRKTRQQQKFIPFEAPDEC